jgi:hypothetical protein
VFAAVLIENSDAAARMLGEESRRVVGEVVPIIDVQIGGTVSAYQLSVGYRFPYVGKVVKVLPDLAVRRQTGIVVKAFEVQIRAHSVLSGSPITGAMSIPMTVPPIHFRQKG